MEIINLDMTPSTVTPNAHAGQYDSARTVRFMLKNGGVPFTLAGTETITAEITRSDNTEVTVNVANTSSNYVDVVFDDTVCTVKGLYACELRLKDSDGFDIGSKNFALLVQRDPYDGKNIRIVTVGPADICTFETTLPEPYQSVTVNVVATGGNGTPSTPIPINGYFSANITANGNVITVNFGQMVYGGVLHIENGRTWIEVTHCFYSGTWGDGGGEYLPPSAPSIKRRTFVLSPLGGDVTVNQGKTKCNVSNTFSTSNTLDDHHYYVYDNLYLYMPLATSEDTVIQCSYVLATPFDIDLTPEVIAAIVGENNVFADCGETTVKYLKVGA